MCNKCNFVFILCKSPLCTRCSSHQAEFASLQISYSYLFHERFTQRIMSQHNPSVTTELLTLCFFMKQQIFSHEVKVKRKTF